jgi:L-asparaginase
VKEIAEVSGEQISNIGSQSMNNRVWLKLGRRLNEVLADPGVDGVVITHGTDTMEETAYFLSLTAKSDKPIVMTGAMRPATGVGADGPMNLCNAICLAANPKAGGRGVIVVLNDEIHYAREVEKNEYNAAQRIRFTEPRPGRCDP